MLGNERGTRVLTSRVIPILELLSAGLAAKSMARAMFASTFIRQTTVPQNRLGETPVN